MFGGLVAHLLLKACQTVLEEAKLFPLCLHFEMLPKSDLWPKSFNMSDPSDDDIALYFFSSEARQITLCFHHFTHSFHQISFVVILIFYVQIRAGF